ncbi:MAG: enoyl-ACP reductase [Rhodobacteraceae bacterium]|nr:enoyl-ACP reductase [Paracoccaceae bacterium]
MPGLLENRRGLIIGVANERSIACGIARSMHAEGASLALTYQNEQLGRRVIPIAETLGADIVECADLEDSTSLDRLFACIESQWGALDFLVHSVAYSDRDELNGRFIDTSEENFRRSLSVSCYSFIDIARRARPLMAGHGCMLTLTFQGSNRVTPFYNVMGIAKAALESTVRYLANDLGREGIRVNAISPGPMKTIAGAAIGGARKTYRHTEANAPMGSNASLEAIGGTAAYLASDYGACTTGEIITVDGGFHILGMPRADQI